MANTHTVVRGDTLWGIAEKYLGSGTKYTQLAAINDIPNPDLIYVGQVIKLSSDGGSSGGSSSSDAKMVTIKQFGLQADVDNVLFVTWAWSRSNTEEYEVRWDYYTNNFTWFGGISSTTTTKDKFATYNIPSNATQVRVRIRPISKKKKEGDKEVSYWTADWCGWKTHAVEVKPDTPSTPTVTLEGLELKAELSNIKGDPSIIQFEVIKDNSTTVKTAKVKVETSAASYTCTVTAGSYYKVRCRSYKDGVWSEWSDYSSNLESAPAVPAGFTKCEAGEPSEAGDPTIVLEWASITTATSYDIEYTTVKSYFDTTDQVNSKTGITSTTYQIVTGIESGKEYFFRIRSVNSRNETSGWSEVSSCIIGEEPAPPTTWSSTTTVIVGEPLYFYWIHNSEDGSSLTYSHIRVFRVLEEGTEVILDWDIDHTEDKETTTGSYEFDTSGYTEGTQLHWAVRTAGISKTYSDYSVQRTVDIYAQPTLEMEVTNAEGSVFDTLNSFPFNISAVPGPATQAPVWYHLEITSNEIYETIDNVGNVKMVNAGEQVYSKHFDISTALNTTISAGDVHLENNISYTITCIVSMNSGLTATASSEFTVSWTSSVYKPDAKIGIDEDTLSAYISPFCETRVVTFYKVSKLGSYYQIDTSTTYEFVSRSYIYVNGKSVIVEPVGVTITGETVYKGVTADGEEVEYCEVESIVPVSDVTLAVYRREFDGSFTELASGLEGSENTFITDPHPALDYARYRIVATSKTTGSVSYYDPPGHPVGGKSVVIQWDEAWSQFDTFGNEDALEQPPWSGSMLKLPYNIDVSNKHSSDVSLVEYIGRKHPVSYYGTQLGESATWSVAIEKSDVDTLYALRRLAVWMGDVYVREPSGSGYWANVKVSFSQKHRELTIPVTLEVTRVEGGA